MERLNQHYALLRIMPGAKLDEIKRAYLLAEQNLHEDRLADDPLVRHLAQDRLRKINEAYMEIMDAYQEVQASLGEGESRDRSAGMQAGSAAAETDGDEARGSSRERHSSVTPKETAQSGNMPPSVAAAGKQPGPPPDDVLADEVAAKSSDPAELLKKESYLLYSLIALVIFVMVVTWINTYRKSSPPDATLKSSATGEPVSPAGESSRPGETAPKSPHKQSPAASRPKLEPAGGDSVDVHVVLRDAEQGNAKAQALLGYMYMAGKGVRKDPAAAAKWFHAAAARGNAQAEDWLGYLYETGTGVTRNYREAVRWYRLAAEQGDADAQKNLGNMYARGKGVARSRHEAIKWLRKAATQGNIEAQRSLEIWQED